MVRTKKIPDFPYSVSDQGEVFRVTTGRRLSPEKTKDGYLRVDLRNNGDRKRVYVHVLVAEAFIGACPEGLLVEHLNGNPSDNRVDNLKYSTQLENIRRKFDHGTMPLGNQHWKSILTDDQYKEIVSSPEPHAALAKRYNVSRNCISQIRLRNSRRI